MLKIVLVCEYGASTGLCVKKMISAAKENGIESEISARSYSDIAKIVKDVDCVLLGPQIGFRLDRIKSQFPDYAEKFAVINAIHFGMMDGKAILDEAIDLANIKKEGER